MLTSCGRWPRALTVLPPPHTGQERCGSDPDTGPARIQRGRHAPGARPEHRDVRESLPAPGWQRISTNGSAAGMSTSAVLRAAAVSGALVARVAAGRADDIHEIFAFSAQFIEGVPTTDPVTSTGQWTAAIKRADEVLGTLGVWKPGGGPAQPNGFSSDVVLGAVLGRVSPSEILIHD